MFSILLRNDFLSFLNFSISYGGCKLEITFDASAQYTFPRTIYYSNGTRFRYLIRQQIFPLICVWARFLLLHKAELNEDRNGVAHTVNVRVASPIWPVTRPTPSGCNNK